MEVENHCCYATCFWTAHTSHDNLVGEIFTSPLRTFMIWQEHFQKLFLEGRGEERHTGKMRYL